MNVRKLPLKMSLHPKPLAVPMVLAGLRPVSLDMDYEIGMKTLSAVVADSWNETALTLMKVVLVELEIIILASF